jgi:hypothetical protein
MHGYCKFPPAIGHLTYLACLLRGLRMLSIFSMELRDMKTKTFSQPNKGSKRRARAHSASKVPAACSPAAHIMAAPRGPRTVSHRRIAEAIEKVFRERTITHG